MEEEDTAGLDDNVENSKKDEDSGQDLSAQGYVHRPDSADELGEDERHRESGEEAHEEVAGEGEQDEVVVLPFLSCSHCKSEQEPQAEPQEDAGEGRYCGALASHTAAEPSDTTRQHPASSPCLSAACLSVCSEESST